MITNPEAHENQSTDSTGRSIISGVGWENGPERGLKTVSVKDDFKFQVSIILKKWLNLSYLNIQINMSK